METTEELGIAHCSVCGKDTEGTVQRAEGKHADLAGLVRLSVHEYSGTLRGPDMLPVTCIGSGSWFKPLT